ncbi:MAG: hypothetical protein HYZ28_08160 [Myxococcales bacterium]|nr:hypothetical protein [Myxococcales bacterium]
MGKLVLSALTLAAFTAQAAAPRFGSLVCRYTGETIVDCPEAASRGLPVPIVASESCCDVRQAPPKVAVASVKQAPEVAAPDRAIAAPVATACWRGDERVEVARARDAGPPAGTPRYVKLKQLLI